MAWSRQDEFADDDDRIYFSPNTETIGGTPQWGPKDLLDDRRTSSKVAISAVGPGGCMARTGSTDGRIWYSRWDTAAGTWGPQIASRFFIPEFPTLAQYREHTFMFWNNSTPADPDYQHNEIAWAELDSDGYWTLPFTPNDYWHDRLHGGGIQTDGVTAAWDTHMDALYLAWRSPAHDNAIQFMGLDQSGWDKDISTVPGAAASAPPALASDGNILHLAWRDADSDQISWTWSVNGNWTQPQHPGDWHTSSGPVLAALNTSDVVMAWKGGGPDSRIWWSRLQGSILAGWQDQQPLPDQQIHADLQPTLWTPPIGY